MADSITISITIPTQLEQVLQKEADVIGISRSRHIGNILLERQASNPILNDCSNNSSGYCSEYDTTCNVDQANAETCESYTKG